MGSSIAARSVSFRFIGDPNRVANAKAALEHLAARDLQASGVSQMEINAGPNLGGGVNTIVVGVGSAITSNGRNAIAEVGLAGQTIVLGAVGVGNSDGVGGAYVAPVAGSYIAVHLIVDENNVTRAVITSDGVAGAAQAALSAHVATLAATDLGSKMVGIIMVGVGPAIPDQTVRGDGEVRFTSLVTPQGDISGAAYAPTNQVGGGATAPLLLETPTQATRRKVVLSWQLTSGGGAAIAEVLSVAHENGDAQAAPVASVQITENGGAPLLPGATTTELVTGADGQTIQMFGTNNQDVMNARIVSYDYILS